MTTSNLLKSALEKISVPTDVAHTDQEFLCLLNKAFADLTDEQPSRLVD
jgi:hypothetical protein